MILAAFLLAQSVPAAPQPEDEDIVVRATFGHTTMLFDKGSDGKLRNCRIMVSSGSDRRDHAACEATPVCYARTADQVTDCVELTAVEPERLPSVPGAAQVQTFTLPQAAMHPPPGLAPGQAGPLRLGEESRETERQRVKPLPPPPSAPKDEPAIRITAGNAQDH